MSHTPVLFVAEAAFLGRSGSADPYWVLCLTPPSPRPFWVGSSSKQAGYSTYRSRPLWTGPGSPAAWWLLSELYRSRAEETATIGEHARRAGLAGSSATIAAEQLTGRLLTRRWRTSQNRRITFVTITSAGTDLVEAVRADLEQAVAGLYAVYDAGEREMLHDLLVRIVQAGSAGLLVPPSADLTRT